MTRQEQLPSHALVVTVGGNGRHVRESYDLATDVWEHAMQGPEPVHLSDLDDGAPVAFNPALIERITPYERTPF